VPDRQSLPFSPCKDRHLRSCSDANPVSGTNPAKGELRALHCLRNLRCLRNLQCTAPKSSGPGQAGLRGRTRGRTTRHRSNDARVPFRTLRCRGTLPAGLPLPPCYPGIRPAPMGRTAIQPSRCERRVARRKKPSPPRSTGCRRPLSPHRRGWRAPRLAVATARSAPGPGG
jgi:hypothetical protein